MSDHTPTPWYRSPAIEDEEGLLPPTYTIGPYDVSDKPSPCHYEDTICEVWDGNHPGEGNADFILRAVNNHERLVAVLENVVKTMDVFDASDLTGWTDYDAVIEEARAVLAEVGGDG